MISVVLNSNGTFGSAPSVKFKDIMLTPVTRADLKSIMEWRMHPEVTKYMYTNPNLTLTSQENWYETIVLPGRENGTDYYFIINYKDSPVGLVSVTDIHKNKGAFWAFYLAPDVPRGKGIGSKVEYAILNFVFDTLNLHKLRCEVLASNMKVVEMHKKFGFKQEAHYREFIIKNGEPLDVIGLAILRKEWDNGLRRAAWTRLKSRG